MEGSDEESQAPAAPGPLPLPPPGPLPPPATDEGHLELLGVLRLRVRGLAPWMLPPYFLFNVDIYNYHPRELLAAYPSATAADGSSALYFVNLVRPKTATDSRKKRAVPGGTWKSERSPLPLVSEAIQGARQTFSFTVLGAKGEEIRQGYIMQELTLAGDEGKLDGGADMAVSKIYPSPRGDKAKRKAKPVRVSSRKKRKALEASAAASFSSAPALGLGISSPAPPLRLGASTSSAPPLGEGAASTSSAPHLGQGAASTSSASHLGQGAASTSSASHLGQGAASISSASHLGQAAAPSHARRLLILELDGFSPVGQDFLPQNILRASEVIGRRRVPVDCDDVVLLQKKKKLPAGGY
ncbi:uncharacterized protein [Triticum aestivum]|uniref:uncharacterized protein n=1 Tax=Triticum aestivum TaxID=4565 RepID=UPI001D010DB3|nr:uncharacterized protein LOC123170035 [Triticum aestivum]